MVDGWTGFRLGLSNPPFKATGAVPRSYIQQIFTYDALASDCTKEFNSVLKDNEKTVVFIDGANLYATARGLDFDIDYKKLLSLFQTRSNLVRAYYYTVLIEDQEYSPIRPLVDWLGLQRIHIGDQTGQGFHGHSRPPTHPKFN